MAGQKVDHCHPRVAVGSCDRCLQPCTHGRMSIQNNCIKIRSVLGVPAKSQILWGLVWFVEEAGFGPGVARGTGRLDAQEDGVRVATTSIVFPDVAPFSQRPRVREWNQACPVSRVLAHASSSM